MQTKLRIQINRVLLEDRRIRRMHQCHWPKCPRMVPPPIWACPQHWRILPKGLRDALWEYYLPGPTIKYLKVVSKVEKWIEGYQAEKGVHLL